MSRPRRSPSCAPTASDEFDGTLNRTRWTIARGPAASLPAMGAGALNLAVTNGDIDGTNTAPVSHVGQKTPSGNWQATTKVTLDHDNDWQYGGLVVHVDDDNYTKLTFTRHRRAPLRGVLVRDRWRADGARRQRLRRRRRIRPRSTYG